MPEAREGAPQPSREPGSARPVRVVAAICVVGVVVTALATWTVARADHNTEVRLLEGQTRQAAAVLSTAILTIQQPMAAALEVEAAGPDRGGEAFTRLFSRSVGTEQMFVSGSLWHHDGTTATLVAQVGVAPGMDPRGPEVQDLLDRALAAETSVVDRVQVGEQTRIVYALADPETGHVVYAERAIPADRRSPSDRSDAFTDLDYALYLGHGTDTADMTTTDVDPASLPLDGLTATADVPFGDTVLTLVTSPRQHLGSPLSRWLPLGLLLAGLLLTLVSALVAWKLVRSRQRAESDTDTITTLYQRVDSLYGEQREHFVGLQRALLPQVNPHIPGIEIASQYVAASKGIDIGGDWYSLIAIGDQHFAFVVGDVSGHGIDAVAEMARARFTLRAYLVEGDSPDGRAGEVLAPVRRQLRRPHRDRARRCGELAHGGDRPGERRAPVAAAGQRARVRGSCRCRWAPRSAPARRRTARPASSSTRGDADLLHRRARGAPDRGHRLPACSAWSPRWPR